MARGIGLDGLLVEEPLQGLQRVEDQRRDDTKESLQHREQQQQGDLQHGNKEGSRKAKVENQPKKKERNLKKKEEIDRKKEPTQRRERACARTASSLK